MGKDVAPEEATGGNAPAAARGLRPAKPDFDGLVVVCAKCLRRQGLGGREVGRSLKRAFRHRAFGRKLKVIESGCLGPCPKRMLALATPAGLGRGHLHLLDPDLPPTQVADLLAEAGTRRPRIRTDA